MNFKHLLLPVMAIVPAMSFAATYYVTPDGAGSKDGSSWENAFGVEEFRAQAANNVNGDIYNLAGGVYKPSATVVFKVATGCVLNGNADGERTIFSGDRNNDSYANSGDANRLIRIVTNTVDGDNTKPVVIKNIDFTCVYVENNTDTNDMGALMVDNSGDVLVENCNFYGCWSQGVYGGPCVHSFRSTIVFRNCVFRNNSANYRGAVMRLRSNAGTKGVTTLDRCVIMNNTNYHDLGGAIFVAHGKQLNIINTTIAGNKAASRGAAIFFNGADDTYARELNVIGSTIAGNTITGEAEGAQITSNQSAHINIVNSIIVGGNDKTAAFSFEGNVESDKFSFVSGGWNYVGAILDAVAEPAKTVQWKEAASKDGGDQWGDGCTYASVFGENTVGSNGVIKPFRFEYGATGAQTEAAVADWGITAVTDYNVDQLGNERIAGRMNGAFADPLISTGIDDVTVGGNDVKLIVAGNGVYCIDGYDGVVEAYNITGRRVAVTRDGEISLENMSAGMYVIKAGNAVFKIVKR